MSAIFSSHHLIVSNFLITGVRKVLKQIGKKLTTFFFFHDLVLENIKRSNFFDPFYIFLEKKHSKK